MFALSQAERIDWSQTGLAFLILHGLVFPSSNGYNSYQDRDESSIGGLKHPPKVNQNLFYATLLFDVLAVLLGLLISFTFSMCVLLFVIMSRAYSYRGIRLKKYPIVGYLTVFIFQGGFVYLMSIIAITGNSLTQVLSTGTMLCMGVSSLFIGSMYPLTQIYQHESDKKDGVISISYLLGYNGTFIFSGVLFTAGTFLMVFYFILNNHQFAIWLFLLFMLPMAVRMTTWFGKVRRYTGHASFENTMSMNKVSSVSMNLYFLILALNNYIGGF
jgi:1,4-dihydroxy-2-naphthoate octaprenyltransferase